MTQRALLAKRIGLISIINLLVESGNLILLPILTKNLSISDYGIWVQIIVTLGLIPAIALLGLPFSMVRFLASAKTKKDIQEIFYSSALAIILLSFSASFFIILFSEKIAALLFNDQTLIVRFLALIALSDSLTWIPYSYFRAVQQIKRYSTLTLAKIIFTVSFVAYFVLSGSGIIGAMLGLLLSSFFILFASFIIVIYEIGVTIPTCRSLRDYFSFGVPTIPSNLSGWIVNSSDRYVIALLLGTAAVGYYSPGYTLGNIIIVFIGPFSFLLPAVLSKHFDEDEIDEVKSLLGISLKYFLILAIPAAFGLSLLSEPILKVLTTPDIAENSYLITPFIAFSAVIYGVYNIFLQVIVLEKKTVITGWIWIVAACLNLVFNFVMIPYLGIVGAALSTLIAFAFASAITAHYANKKLKFRIQWLVLLKSVFASLTMSILIIFWNPNGLFNLVAAILSATIIYFLVLLLLNGIRNDELAFLKNLFR